MGRRSATGLPERLTLTLPPDLTKRVYQHHRENALPGTAQDAARDLLSAALDYPEVDSSLTRSARLRGYTVIRRAFWGLARALLTEMEKEWLKQEHDPAVYEDEPSYSGRPTY